MMQKLLANCISTKGYSRSILYNFQERKQHYIPNSLYNLIQQDKVLDRWYALAKTEEEKEIIQEYATFLIEQNCTMFCQGSNEACFVPLATAWETPQKIVSIGLEFTDSISQSFIPQLEVFIRTIEAKNISILYTGFDDCLYSLLRALKNTYIDNIELYLSYFDYSKYIVENFIIENPAISKIILLGAENNSCEYLDSGKQLPKYSTVTTLIQSSVAFIVNQTLYLESLHYNTYYNKKLFIDKDGYIKTDFSSPSIINNVMTVDIPSLLQNKDIERYWEVCKDKVSVCKECEHRYMCYDTRLPEQTKDGEWHYTSDCGYNPYICKWQGEEGYVPVEECGTYSRETGYVPDAERIAQLNEEIWR